MKKKVTACLLALVMLTPIGTAFADCAGSIGEAQYVVTTEQYGGQTITSTVKFVDGHPVNSTFFYGDHADAVCASLGLF